MSDDAQLDKIDRTVFGLMRTKQRRVINLFKSNSTMILQMVSNKGKFFLINISVTVAVLLLAINSFHFSATSLQH